jgi:hypothetical protein
MKRTKRARLPALGEVIPGVDVVQFKNRKTGQALREKLLAAWAAHNTRISTEYLIRRMRRVYGCGIGWSEAHRIVGEVRGKDPRSPTPPRPPVSPATTAPERAKRAPAPVAQPASLEDALRVVRDVARTLGVSITITVPVAP